MKQEDVRPLLKPLSDGIASCSITRLQALVIVTAVLISVLTRLAKPFLSERKVLAHAVPFVIHYAQIELGLG